MNHQACGEKAGGACVRHLCLLERRDGLIPVGFTSLPEFRRRMAVAGRARLLVAGSHYSAGQLALNGYPADRIAVIPPVPAAIGSAKYLQPGEAGRMLFVGQVIRGKGLDLLLEAAARVQGDWRLDVGSRFFNDKLEAERLALRFRKENPASVVTIVRTAAILGRRVKNYVSEYLSLPLVPLMMGYDPLVQLLHEDDAVAAFKLVVEADLNDQYNLAGEGVLPLDFFEPGVGAAPAARPADHRFLQVFDTFILIETPDGVAIIDQHSAHERVLFERTMAALQGSEVAAQRLLLPATVRLTAAELDAVRRHGELLARIGYEAEPFGGDAMVLQAVPNPHPRFDAQRCFEELAADLARDRFGALANRLDRLRLWGQWRRSKLTVRDGIFRAMSGADVCV